MATTDRIIGLNGSVGFKAACRVATTANITLSGEQTIDGVSVVAGDRVLVKNQSTAAENGVYTASTGAWARALDFNNLRDVVNGTSLIVTTGTVSGGLQYRLVATDPVIIGTTSLAFTPATGALTSPALGEVGYFWKATGAGLFSWQAFTASDIPSLAISTAKLAANAVTAAKLAYPLTGETNLLTNDLKSKTANYTVLPTDNGASFKLGGNTPFTLTFSTSATYNAQFQCRVTNTDAVASGAAKTISFTSGRSSIRLYPGQSVVVANVDGALVADPYLERWQPRAQINLYVDSIFGDDANDGLAAGAGRALETITAAVARLYNEIDSGSSSAGPIINLAAGTYTEDVRVVGALLGNIQLFITGAGQAQTTWEPATAAALQARDNGIVTVQSLRFQSTAALQKALYATQQSVIDYADLDFGPFPSGSHIEIDGAFVNCIDPPGSAVTKITGNADYHVNMIGPARWTMGGNTVSLPGALVFTTFCRMIGSGANCALGFNAFTGAGSGAGSTGAKYAVSYNATLFLTGTVFPGATAGSTSNGGTAVA